MRLAWLAVLCACSRPAAPTTAPVEVTTWGSLRELIHEGRTESRVAIAPLLAKPHLYALGAVAGMRGEITIRDGTPWLAIGARDGGRATNDVGGEGATLLVAATVERWRRVTISADIPFADLDRRIEELARVAGVDVDKPFPFLIDGKLADVSWHVLVGPPDRPGSHDHKRNSVTGERAAMTATVVAFFSKHNEGVFTHMGQHIHAHLVDASAALSAHADGFSIRSGSVLAFPE